MAVAVDCFHSTSVSRLVSFKTFSTSKEHGGTMFETVFCHVMRLVSSQPFSFYCMIAVSVVYIELLASVLLHFDCPSFSVVCHPNKSFQT